MTSVAQIRACQYVSIHEYVSTNTKFLFNIYSNLCQKLFHRKNILSHPQYIFSNVFLSQCTYTLLKTPETYPKKKVKKKQYGREKHKNLSENEKQRLVEY